MSGCRDVRAVPWRGAPRVAFGLPGVSGPPAPRATSGTRAVPRWSTAVDAWPCADDALAAPRRWHRGLLLCDGGPGGRLADAQWVMAQKPRVALKAFQAAPPLVDLARATRVGLGPAWLVRLGRLLECWLCRGRCSLVVRCQRCGISCLRGLLERPELSRALAEKAQRQGHFPARWARASDKAPKQLAARRQWVPAAGLNAPSRKSLLVCR